jgi:hypothetical protein
VFDRPDQYLDFNFLRDYDDSSLADEDPFRLRLDSEYVWEGDDDMYGDIVASTQPSLYA